MKTSQLARIQIEIDEDQMNELERLRELGGLRTKKELLNNAFTLLKWAAKERAQGASVVSVNEKEGTYKELEMPFLENIASARSRIQALDSAAAKDTVSMPAVPPGELPGERVSLADAERELILKTLESVQGNRTRAAELLGTNLRSLHHKLKALRQKARSS